MAFVQSSRNNVDWDAVRVIYETEDRSDRALARDAGVSDTALRNRAQAHGWVKCPMKPPNPIKPRVLEPTYIPDPILPPPRIQGVTKAVTHASIADLTARGRALVMNLMAELEFLNEHAAVLAELVESQFTGERDGRVRTQLLKALDHETRTRSSAQLASALQKLNDAAPSPGKKEQAQADAETAGQDSGWGADLGIGSGPAGVTRHPN